MKKRIIIIVSFILIILTASIVIYYTFFKTNNDTQKVIDSLNNLITENYKYFNKFTYGNSGEVSVTAKYKGAHGENFPKDIMYEFNILEYNNLLLKNDTKVYKTNINNDFFKVYQYLKKLDNIKNPFVIDNIQKQNKQINVTINPNHFNKIMQTNYQSIKVNIINTSTYTLYLDNQTINFNESSIKTTLNDYTYTLVKNSQGYSLSINDELKLNAILGHDKNSYSLIINGKAFFIETENNHIIIRASSASSIFNGLNLDINFKDNKIIDNNIYQDNDENPIIRYYSSLDLKVVGNL